MNKSDEVFAIIPLSLTALIVLSGMLYSSHVVKNVVTGILLSIFIFISVLFIIGRVQEKIHLKDFAWMSFIVIMIPLVINTMVIGFLFEHPEIALNPILLPISFVALTFMAAFLFTLVGMVSQFLCNNTDG
jgi:hypothetical protein